MNASQAAGTAISYLSRVTPRGQQEEQELLHVIRALTSISNGSTTVYNERRANTTR